MRQAVGRTHGSTYGAFLEFDPKKKKEKEEGRRKNKEKKGYQKESPSAHEVKRADQRES